MSLFKINVDRLREGPLDLEIHVAPELIDLTDEEYRFIGPVTGQIGFQLVSTDVLANGELQARIEGTCMRCLGHAEHPMAVKVDEIWMKNRPEEPADQEFKADEPLTRSYTGEVIELDESLRELLMAELPQRIVCAPECKGLCPGCGVNLNEEACQCASKAVGAANGKAAGKVAGKAAVAAQPEEESPRLPDWKASLKKIHLES